MLVDGERILSCLTLAVQYQGRDVTTIEGVASRRTDARCSPRSWTQDGFQCGYCTPGQICSAVGMLDEVRRGIPSAVTPPSSHASTELSDEELKERMSGNLCRCGAYVGICDAIRDGSRTDEGRVTP